MWKIGDGQRRSEDRALLTGLGDYTLDRQPEDGLHMVVLRSPAGAGNIRALDVADARTMPGVVDVLTAMTRMPMP